VKRRRAVLGAGAALVIFLLADAFVEPPAHDVHSPGGTPVHVSFFDAAQTLFWKPGPPSESLSDMRCVYVQASSPPTCNGATVAGQFPQVAQTPRTLYLLWPRCFSFGTGRGLNVEYLHSTRSLVIHCYTARPLLYATGPPGANAALTWSLLSVPTESIGPGSLTIEEDDRIEHLIGDQSDEYLIEMATIT